LAVRRRLNFSQRIIAVIGLGGGLFVLGNWLTTLGSQLPRGWVGYAPLSSIVTFGATATWVRTLVWLAMLVLWAAAPMYVLRDPPTERAARGSSSPPLGNETSPEV
jgi:hypothetical protein